jgi:hypothetical protein
VDDHHRQRTEAHAQVTGLPAEPPLDACDPEPIPDGHLQRDRTADHQQQHGGTGAYAAAAGVEYQAGASPNFSITAQDNAHRAFHLKPASDSYTELPFFLGGNPNGAQVYFDPLFNVKLFNFSVGGNAVTPGVAMGLQGIYDGDDPSDGTAYSELQLTTDQNCIDGFSFDVSGGGFANTTPGTLSHFALLSVLANIAKVSPAFVRGYLKGEELAKFDDWASQYEPDDLSDLDDGFYNLNYRSTQW